MSSIAYWETGGGWANSIEWTEPNKSVVGWKTPKPVKGDYLFSPMKSGRTGIFKFTNIKECYNPSDMFFADVEWIGYKGEIEIPPATRKTTGFMLG